MLSSVSSRRHSFLFQFIMTMIIVIFLVGFCPSVSPSPIYIDHNNNNNNNLNYKPNGPIHHPNVYERLAKDDSMLSLSTVQHLYSRSLPFRYVQPRTYANQFLTSNNIDDQVITPKWLIQLSNDDQIYNDDDNNFDDYISRITSLNSRSVLDNYRKFFNSNQYYHSKKTPLEMMNEIVNSIYLKR